MSPRAHGLRARFGFFIVAGRRSTLRGTAAMVNSIAAPFSTWLFHRNQRSGAKAHRAATFRPRFESLEDRSLLSTLMVTNSDDDVSKKGTLRYAVEYAQPGDVIQFTPGMAQREIVLQNPLRLNKDLTIERSPHPSNGPQADRLVTISGNCQYQVFEIGGLGGNPHVVLSGLDIRNGNGGFRGGNIWNHGDLTLRDCLVVNGQATLGGGIFNDEFATLNVFNSKFLANSAFGHGGGIYNWGTLNVTASSFDQNSAGVLGGAIANDAFDFEMPATVTIVDSVISGNHADYGGGVFNRKTLTVINSVVANNDASSHGGGIASGGALIVSGSTLSHNSAVGNGGAIENQATATVTGSVVSDNHADRGGGIHHGFGSLVVTNSIVGDNSAISNGGGIANGFDAVLNVTGGTLSGNSALYGGAIYNEGNATLSESLLSGNFADVGGGINNLGFMAVNVSTLSDNSASYGGGAVNAGTLILNNSRVSGNLASLEAGGMYNLGFVAIFNGCFVSGNEAPIGANFITFGPFLWDSTGVLDF
jgi:predicted outer membrane repeat protein